MTAASPFGERYTIDFDKVREGSIALEKRTVKIRSTRIVRTGEDLPRLTTCYVF